MQSFIVLSQTEEKIEEYLEKLYVKYQINRFDRTIIQSEKALGIDIVREIQKTISLKPLGGEKKALIIKKADTLTIEAQNALLKLLEEPPESAIIILVASSRDLLLPTILSRCSQVQLANENAVKNTFDQTLINSLFQSNTSEKLFIAQEAARNKETAEYFLNQLIRTLREKLLAQPNYTIINNNYPNLIRNCQKTLQIIKTTNANPRLIIENLIFLFP